MINVRNLVKRFGSRIVLDGLTFTAAESSGTVLTGVNGSGRSTFLRILAGLDRANSGEVFIGGIDVRRDPLKARRRIGFLPDRELNEGRLSVREFLKIVARARLIRGPARDLAVSLALERSDLEGGEKIETLSRGLKQRLALATALLHDPDLLLLDEPLCYLDPESARRALSILSDELHRGRTLVIASNEPARFLNCADRVACLERGRILEVTTLSGPPTIEREASEDRKVLTER